MTVSETLKKLKELEKLEEKLIEELNDKRSKQKILCTHCNKYHAIKDLDLIQQLCYVRPHGCTGGDYYVYDELQFICPIPNRGVYVRNRIMFDNYDVEYENRRKFEFNPEDQFRAYYSHLFKSKTEEEQGKITYVCVVNRYVDLHRKKFGLVEKTKTKTQE